jgi:hypothetical protein
MRRSKPKTFNLNLCLGRKITNYKRTSLYKVGSTENNNPQDSEYKLNCGHVIIATLQEGFESRSQNFEKRLSDPSYMSVCPHGTSWLPLDGF